MTSVSSPVASDWAGANIESSINGSTGSPIPALWELPQFIAVTVHSSGTGSIFLRRSADAANRRHHSLHVLPGKRSLSPSLRSRFQCKNRVAMVTAYIWLNLWFSTRFCVILFEFTRILLLPFLASTAITPERTFWVFVACCKVYTANGKVG